MRAEKGFVHESQDHAGSFKIKNVNVVLGAESYGQGKSQMSVSADHLNELSEE